MVSSVETGLSAATSTRLFAVLRFPVPLEPIRISRKLKVLLSSDSLLPRCQMKA